LLQAPNQFQDSLDEDDEDLPSGLLSALEEFRTKLEVIKVCKNNLDVGTYSFSKVDAIPLIQVGIKTGLSAEELGSTEVDGKALTMEVLKQLIGLVRRHVSVVVCEFSQSLPFYTMTPSTDGLGAECLSISYCFVLHQPCRLITWTSISSRNFLSQRPCFLGTVPSAVLLTFY